MSRDIAWSDEQEAIFSWFEDEGGNLVVRARAGTGKTTTILEGVKRAPEKKILLAAFNKTIATELQRRVSSAAVEAKTLHGLGFSFLRKNWTNVRLDEKGNRAMDLAKKAAPDAPDPIARIVAKLHSKAREVSPFASVSDLADIGARFDIMPDKEWEPSGWGMDHVCEVAKRAMDLAKERTVLIDFADMIYLPLVHHMLKPWYGLVVIDEAQDMTNAQLMIAMGACKKKGRIAVVGDDRQAIYGFRGADSGSLDRLKKELSAEELGLKTTYRCPKTVVALAATIVPDFRAAASAPEGKISVLKEDKLVENSKEGDFILSRTNAPLVRHCLALLRAGRRAKIKGRDIGKGIIALINKQKADSVPDLVGSVAEWSERERQTAMRLEEKAQKTRLEFLDDQEELIKSLSEGAATVAEVKARADALFADDAERGNVMLSTVHKAKGLEADRVFLLEETFKRSKNRPDVMAGGEEANIRYVAITRAKKELFLVGGSE